MKPVKVAVVNPRVWLEVLPGGTVRVVAGRGIQVAEPVDPAALRAALDRLESP